MILLRIQCPSTEGTGYKRVGPIPYAEISIDYASVVRARRPD